MIVRPENMDFSKQTFSMIIYGSPGIGKTTLALSAPKPILLDFDHGISRVAAKHRAPTSISETYEEVLADINSPDMRDFETIVLDTGGSFVTYLKDWAMRTKPDAKTKAGTFNSLKGFGYVKAEFQSFTERIKTVLNKNIIYVFHSTEEKDKDGNPTQRLMCEGAARNTVWNGCDFGGYVQMIGNKRTICFSPEQEFFAKGTHGITGHMVIPSLEGNTPNDFVTRMFETARKNIIAEKDEFTPQKDNYELVMQDVRAVIDGVVDTQTADKAMETIPKMNHALTSLAEARAMLKTRAESLGLKYDKKAGGFVAKVSA